MSKCALNFAGVLLSFLLISCGGGGSSTQAVSSGTQPKLEEQERSLDFENITFKNPETIAIDRIIVKLIPSVETSSKSFNDSAPNALQIQTQQALSLLREVADDTYVLATSLNRLKA